MIPRELTDFFKEKGRILLIKGRAGTGKTLFGFRLIKEMNDFGDVIWINSRDMDSADIAELKEIIPEKKRLNATSAGAEYKSEPEKVKDRSHEYRSTEFEIIDALYEEVSAIENPTVVVDSFEGLTTDLNESGKENLRIKLVRLSRETKTNIAVIMETFEPNQLDYLADGVITLDERMLDDRRIREINFSKLRGTLIKMPSYLFSLNEGNFNYFPPFALEPIKKPIVPVVISDFDKKISSGITDFDILLNGGYTKGSVHLFERETTIGKNYEVIFQPTIVNHLNQNRGLLYIPSGGWNTQKLLDSISPYVSKAKINKYISSVEKMSYDSSYEHEVYRIFGESIKDDIDPLLITRNKYSVNGPNLIFIGTDILEYTYDSESAHRKITDLISETRLSDDVVILLATEDQKLSERIAPRVDTYWKIRNIHDSIVIYGRIPRTELYSMSCDSSRGYIDPKFHPIL